MDKSGGFVWIHRFFCNFVTNKIEYYAFPEEQ